MALNKAALKTALQSGLESILNNPETESNVATVSDQIATLISDEVDAYVKQGQIIATTSDGATIVMSQII